MIFRNLLLASLVSLMPLPVVAATVYEIDASSVAPASFSDFSLTFEDFDNDMLFNQIELISFSGVNLNGFEYSHLAAAPFITNVADGTFGTSWVFSGNFQGINLPPATPSADNWTYTKSVVPVPLPASFLLVLAGLAGFVRLGVKKRRVVQA